MRKGSCLKIIRKKMFMLLSLKKVTVKFNIL